MIQQKVHEEVDSFLGEFVLSVFCFCFRFFFFQLVLLVHSLVQADILLVSVGGVLSPVFFQRV